MVESDNGTYVMPTETRQALDEVTSIYAPRDYQPELALHLCMLVVAGVPALLIYIGTLGCMTHSVNQKKILKHAMAMCIDLWLAAAVMLQCHNRAQCTEKDVCNFPSLAWINVWIQYESTAWYNGWAAIGIGYVVWRCGFADVMSLDFTALRGTAKWLMCKCFASVPFNNATPEEIVCSYMPLIGISAAVGFAVRMPDFMCAVQCIWTCQELLVHMTRCAGIWCSWWPTVNRLFDFLDMCGFPATAIWNASQSKRKIHALVPGLAGGAPAGPALIATEKNVKMITENLGERILGSPDFQAVGAKKRNRTKKAVWDWYEEYCTVDDRKPLVTDIQGVLTRANFQVTSDAEKFFLYHELERLGFFP